MAREKVKQVQVFSLPTEYERQTAEARRREMMAEMLAQQAYDPGQYQGAPIPKAAPVVKALEGYLRGREMRKAREAGEAAEKAGRTEFADYIRSFEPERRTVSTADVAAMEMPTPSIDASGRVAYTPASAIAAPNQQVSGSSMTDPLQMQVGGPLSMAQRRARALEGFESTNPMVQQFAAAQYEKTMPRELDLKLAPIDPEKVDLATVAEAQRTGDISKIKPRVKPPEEMTPYQKKQIEIEEEKLKFQKSKAGQAGERPKPPSGFHYVDETSTDLAPNKGGPQDPNRPMTMPLAARNNIITEQDNSRQFAIASQRTSKFIKDIQDGKLPLYKGAGAVYATERMFGGDEVYDEENRPAYDRYYDLERFVTEQVNMILSRAKGPQTDQDALRARQQILDNLDNKQVVTTALKTLDRLWNDEINLSEFTIDDWYSQYNQSRPLNKEDTEALNWANANPTDPRAAEIKSRLGGRR